MKAILIQCAGALITLSCFAQQPQTSLASLTTPAEHLSVIKRSIEIPVWHEKTFWPLYEKYLDDEREIAVDAYRAMSDLANLDEHSTDEDALDFGRKLIETRKQDLALRKQYYAEIGSGFNGTIALQFLQAETLMDMMQSFAAYDDSPWKSYRFNAAAVPADKLFSAKMNMLTAALSMSGQTLINFRAVYSRYVRECNDLLGETYDIYSLFAGEPTGFTPALAKRLGYDLLAICEREIRLKEKYFDEMSVQAGPRLAAGFLAWEDYHSLVGKMHAWADAP